MENEGQRLLELVVNRIVERIPVDEGRADLKRALLAEAEAMVPAKEALPPLGPRPSGPIPIAPPDVPSLEQLLAHLLDAIPQLERAAERLQCLLEAQNWELIRLHSITSDSHVLGGQKEEAGVVTQADGHLYLFPAYAATHDGDELMADDAKVHIWAEQGPCDSQRGMVELKGGQLYLLDGAEMTIAVGSSGEVGLRLSNASIHAGGQGAVGRVSLSPGDGFVPGVQMAGTGEVEIGRSGLAGRIRVYGADPIYGAGIDAATVEIRGDEGDVILRNGDCAEEFELAQGETFPEPGTVMVAGGTNEVRASTEPYDTRVLGVVSGAGDLRPAIVLGRTAESDDHRVPVALMGKVECLVDADYVPIEHGDLLVSSDTPGHAMKSQDAARRSGAVIGKALGSRCTGRGLLPVLVTLQ